MAHLKVSDQCALGFMVFALFLGAGNIIFPPSAGLGAGTQVVWAALGFLITAVGLPLLTIVAVARVGGSMSYLTQPLGHWAALLLTVTVYLAIGPLFATPRTAVVSFEMAFAPITGDNPWARGGYVLLYFALVLFLALRRGQLMDNIGKLITPVLLLGLAILGLGAVLVPVGPLGSVAADYQDAPFLKGVLEGYLTMDMLGALIFGVVVSNAIRDHGVSDPVWINRYSIRAGLLAALGLVAVYLSFFYLGATSGGLVAEGSNGVQILAAHVRHQFGAAGQLLLALIIVLACVTTAVGLIVACATYFNRLLPRYSYAQITIALTLFSLLIANRGLSQLLSVSIPVLVGLYPLAIVLVALNLLMSYWSSPERIFGPVMVVTLIFGIADGLVAANLGHWVPHWVRQLPLAEQGLGWLLPSLSVLGLAVIADRQAARRAAVVAED